jgi:hypothetical protein
MDLFTRKLAPISVYARQKVYDGIFTSAVRLTLNPILDPVLHGGCSVSGKIDESSPRIVRI